MQAAFISKAPGTPEEKIVLLGLKKFKGVYPLEREGEREKQGQKSFPGILRAPVTMSMSVWGLTGGQETTSCIPASQLQPLCLPHSLPWGDLGPRGG